MPSEPRRHGRYVILLVSLLLMVAVRPLVLGNYLGGLAVEGAAAVLILIFVTSMRRRVLGLAVVFLVGTLVSGYAVGAAWDGTAASLNLRFAISTLLFAIAYLALICSVILGDVLVSVPVTRNTICGALCVYLLAGAIWANLYFAIYLVSPNSFVGAPPLDTPVDSPTALDDHSSAFLYYSFATVTTLGMGDITPRSPLSRTLSWMEAVLGQIYLAVLVARLIALQQPPGEEDVSKRGT